MRPPASLLVALVASGCAGGAPAEPPPRAPVTTLAGDRSSSWPEVTRSPWPVSVELDAAARERALAGACGAPDAALHRVARAIAERRARGLGTPDPDAVTRMLREAGEPHVRPRVMTAAGQAPLEDAILRGKLEELRTPQARCGVGLARVPHGGEVLVAVAVEALADLEPLPLRARVGQWLSLEAQLHVRAREAQLVVLGPRGAPRTVPTSLDPTTGRARARFAADRPGAFTVQLVADVEGGPRPLLEARLFADAEPTAEDADEPAPGEETGGGARDAAALARMIAALRELEGLPPLARDERLERLAHRHATRMAERGALAHDVGDGDLRARFEEEGLAAVIVGENVARAATLERAHRALHASPSHRMNLLRADYTHVGVAAVEGEDGTLYVCEVFAAGLR